VGRDLAHVTFDSVLKKYVIQVDSTTGGGSGTVTSVAATAPAAGFTISGSPITTAGTFLFTLADDLAALEALSGTGILARTAANTYALRTITAGTGISVADGNGVAGNPTITNTSPDQVVSITGAGINVTTGTYPTFTITGTEVDGLVTNEGSLTVGAGTGTTSLINSNTSGSTPVTITAAGILTTAEAGNVITLTATEVDGSVSNELQTIANSSNATTHTATLSNTGGSFQLAEGSGITITTTGTGLNGIATIASTATGTVTSVGLSMPSIFSVSGSPVTTSGTLTATLAAQTANRLFAGPASGGAAIPTFRNMVTADIQNSIVTYAKVQNVTANRLLGRSNSGVGVMQEITLGTGLSYTGTTLNAATGVTGSGTTNRFALWTSATTIGSDAAFTFDGVNDRMTVTGTVAGGGPNLAFLNLNSGTISGTTEFLRMAGNINGVMATTMENSNNAGPGSATIFQMLVGGTSAGDPILQFSVAGAVTMAQGIDNSDGDKFKITPNSSTPGGLANSGLIITQDATPLVGINRDAPAHALDVTGRTRSSTGFMGAFARWVAGNIVFGAGAGTGPVLDAHAGTDNALYVSFTTGTTPTNNAVIFTGTYPTAWTNVATVTFSADGTNNSATDIAKFRTGGRTAAKFDFIANGTLTANRNYQFCFTIWGQ
jgi:hypothetical protein